MSQIVDNLISLRVLHLLLTKIEKSDAYRLGLIDKNGKQIKKPKTEEERDSWTNLTKIIFKLKGIIAKNLQGEKDLRSIANSMHIAKECQHYDADSLDIESLFEQTIDYVTEADIEKLQSMMSDKYSKSFKDFISEDAPANNASATPGVAVFEPAERVRRLKKRTGISDAKLDDLMRRNRVFNRKLIKDKE
mgnify:FL=1